MDLLFVAWLLGILKRRRQRSYTAEQFEQIERESAQREGRPMIKGPKRPYRWWRYEGLV